MICDRSANCPHCRVAATLDAPEKIKWDALLRAFEYSRLSNTPPAEVIKARAESIRTAKPFGRRA